MLAVLASPRRRRRLAYASGAVLVVAVVAAIVAVQRDVDPRPSAGSGDEAAAPALERPATPLEVTPAVRRDLDETIDAFLRTAVIRKDVDRAWSLASPALRAGTSRRDWSRGELPVVPYPADALATSSWKLVYAEETSVGVDVLVVPKKGTDAPTMVYSVQLSPSERARGSRWLVDYWVPQTTLVGPSAAPADKPERAAEAAPQPSGRDVYDQGKLGPEWFAVPGVLLLLLVLTPVVVAVRGALRNRRAERLYRESRG